MTVKIPTVLVLGAGASVHCRYPLGVQLLAELSNLRGKILPGGLPGQWSITDSERLLAKLSRSAHYSVDAFLEETDENVSLGKYLIAHVLKQFEVVDQLFPPHNSGWYQYLFNRLIPENGNSLDENNLSIITFNYDRSLETYLYNVFQSRFSLSEELALKELRKIPIIHVHGILGEFPKYPYQLKYTPEELLKISEAIKIIHEIKDGKAKFSNDHFREAHKAIEQAEKVYFLGFGFHYDNVRRLGVDWSKKDNGKIFATMPGTSPGEYVQLIKRLEPLGLTSKLMPQSGHICENVFRHVSPLE